MLNKNIIINKINLINNVLAKNGLENILKEDIDRLNRSINEYKFKVLMIGGFNAGKSSFLNTLLDSQILQESQVPETTIATEIVFDNKEYIEAIDNCGKSSSFSFDEETKFSPEDYRYLIYHLNNKFLYEHSDITFVDMPGLDSNLEIHNKAISQYISNGSAYILLVSCEDGTVKQSTVEFLNEITQYPQSLICFVSKCDLKIKSEIDDITEYVGKAISNIYGVEIKAEDISVFNENFKDKVVKKISEINIQKVFENKYKNELQELRILAINALQTAYEALSLDIGSLNKSILDCQKNKEELERALENEIYKLKKKYESEIIPSIISDLEYSLKSRSDELTSALIVSPEAFSSLANSIIRPILYNSTQKYTAQSFNDLIENIDLSFLNNNNENLKSSIIKSAEVISSYINKNTNKVDNNKKKDNNNYKILTTILAIATDVVNPLIELFIVFLPNILDIASDYIRKTKVEEVKEQVKSCLIPTIIERIVPEIEESVYEVRDLMVQEIKDKMSNMILVKEEALKDAINKKEQATLDYQSKNTMIKNNIYELQQMIIE